MFNKFKNGEIVLCCGIGKATKKYFYEKGKVIEKDYYFKDYCVLVGNGIEEWFNERDLIKISK